MRQFIRHAIDVPVRVGFTPGETPGAYHTHDIGEGGLAFRCSCAVPAGRDIDVCIDSVDPPFRAQAQVAWCRPHVVSGYELGVRFLDAEDAFRARMVAQVCAIEDYRRSVRRTEGRELGAEEAAAEWIERHAADFPPMH
ncbi:PilZ domain-containing protein [Ideonella sp.]|uniref:PilZ domain-containing protein n=1 Tax=Ideonella sp. TaxID=1929293 RepID=UPI0035B1B0B4